MKAAASAMHSLEEVVHVMEDIQASTTEEILQARGEGRGSRLARRRWKLRVAARVQV
jgi:hypothetical protein